MSSFRCARSFYVDITSAHRRAIQLFALVLTSATLAACAQSSTVANKSELLAATRQASLNENHKASTAAIGRVAVRSHSRFEPDRHAARDKGHIKWPCQLYQREHGRERQQFNPNELTAAHPNLPFGTKLRVTDVATGGPWWLGSMTVVRSYPDKSSTSHTLQPQIRNCWSGTRRLKSMSFSSSPNLKLDPNIVYNAGKLHVSDFSLRFRSCQLPTPEGEGGR